MQFKQAGQEIGSQASKGKGRACLLPSSMSQHAAMLQDQQGFRDSGLLGGALLGLAPLEGLNLNLPVDTGKATALLQHSLQHSPKTLSATTALDMRLGGDPPPPPGATRGVLRVVVLNIFKNRCISISISINFETKTSSPSCCNRHCSSLVHSSSG